MNHTNIIEIIFLSIFIILILFILNKINETLNKKLTQVHSDFTNHLLASQDTISAVTKDLTELQQATQNILEVGKNIQSLQDILKPPKLRGALGELFLEQALSQVLPSKHYQMSYKFQTGDIVDAIIKLKDSQILCIDAKFPLDSLREYLVNGAKTLECVPSQFVRDVKKHIDAISSKYILTQEGTLDFALMYIPAENVFYEIILKDNQIMSYALEKHVIPTSPISLYSYLSTILIGLKGMEIEKNAKQILGQIGDLKVNLDNFLSEYNTLGSHLTNAKTKYDTSREVIINLSNKLKNIEVSKEKQVD